MVFWCSSSDPVRFVRHRTTGNKQELCLRILKSQRLSVPGRDTKCWCTAEIDARTDARPTSNVATCSESASACISAVAGSRARRRERPRSTSITSKSEREDTCGAPIFLQPTPRARRPRTSAPGTPRLRWIAKGNGEETQTGGSHGRQAARAGASSGGGERRGARRAFGRWLMGLFAVFRRVPVLRPSAGCVAPSRGPRCSSIIFPSRARDRERPPHQL